MFIVYPLLFLLFVISLLLYFRIAEHFGIVDKPNLRSSHSIETIRGGGIVYLLAALIIGLIRPDFILVVSALLLIGAVSFIDDRVSLSNRIRIVAHLFSVSLIFYFLNVFDLFNWWIIVPMYVVVIGVINAYNFMDGINGITGTYSLAILCGLQMVNTYKVSFIEPELILVPIVASLAFLLFNFRTRARCFAGDVGSITIALWIIFILVKLMIVTESLAYILFLALYGVDTVLTIIHRLILKQNIFDAHRLHFYQVLANERKIPHLVVASIYSILQFCVIIIVVFFNLDSFTLFAAILVPLTLVYVSSKSMLMAGASSNN